VAPVNLHPLYKDGPRGSRSGLVIDQALVDRLAASFAALRPASDALAQAFYRRLFRKKPDLEALFTTPMEMQRQKLIASLEAIVLFLSDPASQRTYLKELGRRHVGYGARPEHYGLVIETMLEAMDEASGGLLDPMVRSEWRDVLQLVSEWMIDGAHGPARATSSVPHGAPRPQA
jgi:methyl-accepting chemotaxis protein